MNSPRFHRAPTDPRAERETASASGGSTPPRTVPCRRWMIPPSADSTPPLTRLGGRGGGGKSDRLRVNPTPSNSVRLHPGQSGLGTSHGHRHSSRVRAAAELHGLHGFHERGYPVRSDSIRLNPTTFGSDECRWDGSFIHVNLYSSVADFLPRVSEFRSCPSKGDGVGCAASAVTRVERGNEREAQ